LGLELKIKYQFSTPRYAFGDQKDAPGWVWGFLDATLFDCGSGRIESGMKLQISFILCSPKNLNTWN
jgi:hypothetical protein